MASEHSGGAHQGSVNDPEHDGRLKENREAGRTKGTTEGSRERAAAGGHSGAEHGHGASGSKATGESSDLASREYRDSQGQVHHHTHTAGKSGKS